jgi:hypothetical protein
MCLNETDSRVRVGKNLSDKFTVQNGLKQGHALSPLLFNFSLECAIRRVQEKQDGLILNGTHQLSFYTDNVIIVGETIDTIQKNTKPLLGMEVNPEKSKYMLMSRCQNAGQRQSVKIANRSFEDVAKFKYLGTTLTDQNYVHEEIKSRLKVKIYKTIILPLVLYGCETWSLTLREERRLRVSENRVVRRIFGLKRDEVTGEWRKLHNEELHNLYSSRSSQVE